MQEKQKIMYNETMTQETALHIMQTGKNVFLTGAPGAGKTYVLNQYLDYLKSYGIYAAVTAPTGIAASHINGMTLHSFFGIGIREELSPYEIEALTEKKYLWDRMKNLKVLVIDEVSMLSPKLFKTIDAILKTFKFSTEPFGGVQVVLVGDFFQLPPIQKEAQEKRFIFQTDIWKELNLHICYLTTSYRHEDETLLEILNEIRNGEVSEDSMNHFRSRYKKHPEGNAAITRLYTHNMDVDTINARELAKIDEPLKVYEAQTKGAKKWVERIFASSLVLPRLELKLGALVFFIKNNYEKDKNFINGTLGTIVDFDVFNTPIVETRDGRRIKADRMEWTYEDHDGKPKAVVKQIPLRLAWAITVHKSQGMTLDAAEVDLSKAFEPGQGYVALSRIKSLSGLKLMGLNDTALRIDPQVLNADASMREHSEQLYTQVDTLDEAIKKREQEAFMQFLGGSIEKGETKKKEAKKAKEKAEKPKIKSFLETKILFKQKKSIAEVAKERDMTEATIMKHLTDIMKDDPEFDITHLQPDYAIIEKVEKAVVKIRERNNQEDFSENGDIRLKPIFIELNEEVSYDDIRLALLFL